jgi:hypothetical protein
LLVANSEQSELEAGLGLRWETPDVQGTLGNLCAIDAFVNSNEIHRTVLLPAMGDEPPAQQLPPNTVVVFDGSNAFMRHHHCLPDHDQVVLISADKGGYPEAIAELNSAFASRLGDLDCPLDRLPSGVEAMAWTERRHAG